MRIFLADVSHHQGGPDRLAIDWNRYRATGRAGALCKATQHTTFVDPKFSENRTGMAGAGLVFRSVYHFAGHQATKDEHDNPVPPRLDPVGDEVDHYIETVGALNGEVPALDFEVAPPGMSARQMADWAVTWLERVEAHYDALPLFYTGESFINDTLAQDERLRRYPLWVAAYRANDGTVPAPAKEPRTPWPWTFWQYSSVVVVDGVPRPTDDNVFDGTVDDLAELSTRLRGGGGDDLSAEERALLLQTAARITDLHAAMSEEKVGAFPQPRIDALQRAVAALQAKVRALAAQVG